jgi:hypothetical protein
MKSKFTTVAMVFLFLLFVGSLSMNFSMLHYRMTHTEFVWMEGQEDIPAADHLIYIEDWDEEHNVAYIRRVPMPDKKSLDNQVSNNIQYPQHEMQAMWYSDDMDMNAPDYELELLPDGKVLLIDAESSVYTEVPTLEELPLAILKDNL